MPIILGILGAIVAAYFFFVRARNAGHIASDVLDAANDVRLAARRFGFKRNANRHPMEDVDDANVACAVVGLAYIQLDGPASATDHARLKDTLATTLEMPQADADELLILARWLIDQCNGASPAFSRAARKLYKMERENAAGPMLGILSEVAPNPSERQKDALQDARVAFHLKG
ncbi:MAG: hypothetical protein AAGF78_06305 [Pseudomonadota bacterium]